MRIRKRDKEKEQAYRRKYYERKKLERGTAYDRVGYARDKHSPRCRSTRLLHSARGRNKYPVEITVEFVEARMRAGVCEVTGLPLVLDAEGRHPFAPSLDRRDNTAGYTPENTQLVCWMYNAAKGTATHEDVLKFAEALCTHEKR